MLQSSKYLHINVCGQLLNMLSTMLLFIVIVLLHLPHIGTSENEDKEQLVH